MWLYGCNGSRRKRPGYHGVHSQKIAKELAYKAMQFNLVVATNKQAVSLWTKLGFDTVGKIPKAFNHPKIGYVDALVMHKWL